MYLHVVSYSSYKLRPTLSIIQAGMYFILRYSVDYLSLGFG